ncbi:hypothetical protein FB451DRAFT_1351880 [Mycena latifolia]|nr:hypothetical protein FB451DRAFT_1351880 [Mycena latifolia]
MNTSKYPTLPDIDSAQDGYETEDPLPSLNRHTKSRAGASKGELDSTNFMQDEETREKLRKAEKRRDRPGTQYVYPPSSTDSTSPFEPSTSHPVPLSLRLRALQEEVISFETELADSANPLRSKEQEEDPVDPGELIRGLVDARSRLDKIRRGRKAGEDCIVEMDRRVGELEKLVGSRTAALDESSPLPPPSLPLVTRLNAQFTRNRASASHHHSHSQHPSQSNSGPPSQVQDQMLPLLSRLGPSLPHILIRSRTLSALHSSAGQFESTLEGLEDQRKNAGGARRSKSLKGSRGVVKGNVGGLKGG